MKEFLQPLLDWYLQSLKAGGYPLVALLMAIESSIVPLPSEVVIPPAAHLAWQDGLVFLGITFTGWTAQAGLVLAGTIGSWVGASAMYWASRLAGRPLVMRYGKYVLIPSSKVEGAERWTACYGSFGIFASRLLPVVRHLIGIPAGIVRMNYLQFSLYTLLGSGIWCAVLCWLGVKIGGDISKGAMHQVTLWSVGFLAVVGALYYLFVHRHLARKTEG
ncbi:MAG: DedA family protein [Verrucomicrobia bacterium]|jgi:membrane protein DedA with SNARE-associated domain|nr:DedA family protein [Verrucomicrobiota bacterium]